MPFLFIYIIMIFKCNVGFFTGISPPSVLLNFFTAKIWLADDGELFWSYVYGEKR